MVTKGTTRRTYHLYKGELPHTTTTDGSSRSTTSTTNGRKHDENLMDLESIKRMYHDCLSLTMPGHIENQVAYWLETNFVPPEYVMYALQEASMAPRPSWKYALAIIRRLGNEKYPVGLLPVTWI